MQATPAAQAVHKARDFKHRADPGANNDNADPFLSHYFRRIDPDVANSFNEEQLGAIRTMFSNRGIAAHSLEVRRTLSFGRKRFYLIFLLGRERRAYERNGRSGSLAQRFNLFFYFAVTAAWLVPGFLLAKLIG
ncbi:hypothetical protein [Pelagibius sp. Alg239-R121]|uniref:hypothetical protein n=1 Tax=Pelagibius sp. Alg239-R121 TaxID=2993448 RepID=UPI0024A6FB97|nr:hypothetical protein [Pelagibius sp. Alg239-R121]